MGKVIKLLLVIGVVLGSLGTVQAEQSGRVVIGVSTWAKEAPFAWNQTVGEKRLWDHIYDALIDRDPETSAQRPGLAIEWKPSKDYKVWTFKLRPGVQFHDGWGELTAEDVKFTIEQHFKPGAIGAGIRWCKATLDRVEAPDKYTLVLYLKKPSWDVPTQFSSGVGYMNIASKKYLEKVGEEKARKHPIGSGPFKYVEGRQGDYHRFEALPKHWRQTAGFKELVVRLMPEQSSALSGLRSGEVDIITVTGDFLLQAKQAGFKIHEIAGGLQYWIVLPGQTTPDKPDYCPTCPWVGDPKDPKSQENARKVRLALNLAVNKQAIIDKLWHGYGSMDPYNLWYFPNRPGFSQEWKIPPYDPQKAKQLLAEAGCPQGFEITMGMRSMLSDAPDVAEAVAMAWERIGIKVKRHEEPWGTFVSKLRKRNTGGITMVYNGRYYEDPIIVWNRTILSTGPFYYAAESPEYDEMLKEIYNEFDVSKRAQLTRQFGQKLDDDVRVVKIAWKSNCFALSNKIASWGTRYGSPYACNYEYITMSGQ